MTETPGVVQPEEDPGHPEDPPADVPEKPPTPEGWGEESEEIPGGIQTTDPTFADGAQETEEPK